MEWVGGWNYPGWVVLGFYPYIYEPISYPESSELGELMKPEFIL
jgi:hypothetical protein